MTTPDTLLTPLGRGPRVYLAEGFAAPGEIDHVLSRYGGHAPPARDGVEWDHGVAGRAGELPVASDPVLGALAARIEAMLGFSNRLPDPAFRFRRYAPGDHHPAHVDCYAIAGLHLVATVLVYLTDAADGGETVFPDALDGPLAISARRGRLAMWFNYTPDGEVDRLSRHRSELLRAGDKSTLAYFVYAPLACAAGEPVAHARPLAHSLAEPA